MAKIFNDYSFLAKYQVESPVIPFRHKIAIRIVDVLDLSHHSLLDVGGGTSSYLKYVKGRHRAVCDMEPSSIESSLYEESFQAALPTLQLEDCSYDVVSAFEVLEHMPLDMYLPSVKELGRITNDITIISAPFMQDLTGAYCKCASCGCIFQCEGHYRSFDIEDLKAIQEHLGTLAEVYFCCPSNTEKMGISYGIGLKFKKIVKARVRFAYQLFGKKFAKPPFTKCPSCNTELFHDYAKYKEDILNKVSEKTYAIGYLKTNRVSFGTFVAIYTKKNTIVPYVGDDT